MGKRSVPGGLYSIHIMSWYWRQCYIPMGALLWMEDATLIPNCIQASTDCSRNDKISLAASTHTDKQMGYCGFAVCLYYSSNLFIFYNL